uniref:Dimer_Tnp_hAT domain-containing protein n=1 Tax=Steinernema glaseri TaxID=37863 RepID=A0A1I7YV87_9BILA
MFAAKLLNSLMLPSAAMFERCFRILHIETQRLRHAKFETKMRKHPSLASYSQTLCHDARSGLAQIPF